ncbi:non-homologous end-joining factor 1-like [Styela clava]
METRGWKLLTCDKGETKFLIKLNCQDNSSYNLIICDLVNIWEESLSNDDIKIRCKQLNRRLEAPTQSILLHIQETLLHHTTNVFTVVETSKELVTISLKNSFQEGIPFLWEFTCKMVQTQMSIGLFVEPFLKLVASLQCSNDQLIKVIKKKDAEIRDYKESGSKVSRPYLETSEFDSEAFQKDVRQTSEYVSAIIKDSFMIATDDSINLKLVDVEADANSPPSISNSSSLSGVAKTDSPVKRATAKIAGHKKNRIIRGGRRQPMGVEVLSDSDSDVDAKPTPAPVKRASNQEQKKATKKKKVIDKRKKLF